MTKKNLSGIEQLVLSRLEIDSRMPFSGIGKSIRKSQQQVSYTVGSLTDRGLISRFMSLIDYSKFGVLNFRVYFTVNYIDKSKFDELIDYLVKEPHTSWVVTCGGRYDLICSFFAPNPSHFSKTLRTFMERFPMQLQNYRVLTTVVVRKFGRKYLLKNPGMLQEIVIGGDSEREEVDKTDIRILMELSENARKSSVSIAQELSVSTKTVIDRIKKLYKRGIIKGARPIVNIRKTGFSPGLLMVKYHNITSDAEKEFIEYLRRHPNVRGIAKTLGEWNMEIYLEAKDALEKKMIEMEIRQSFPSLIQQTESIPLYQTYKKCFFPRFLVD
ncbi:MAG: Lrp/AsnC family transcriptional regulator [Candidatus Aenigmarchaeota archaeon]|nr:Lrp/AsnC family transcriptional regulator [Candidatus Aenigmarchaeota archaeon]